MRDYIVVYINGKRHEIKGEQALMSLSDYLRYEKSKTGTKVVCAEGDCGACTVMLAPMSDVKNDLFNFKSINSCITFMYLLDCSQIITVEGLKIDESTLHPVQQAMVENNGAQCGYCTPGFISAMISLTEDAIISGKKINEKKVKNYLTGNLCRCTGYEPIINACLDLDLKQIDSLQKRYHSDEVLKEFKSLSNIPVYFKQDKITISLPTNLSAAKEDYRNGFKITSGSTDLGVLVNKNKHTPVNIMSLTHIDELNRISEEDEFYSVGARVTLHDLGRFLEGKNDEFSDLLHIFASPQIKNSATLIGNVANASPIGDTIPFLMVNESLVEVQSEKDTRRIPITELYRGYKDLAVKPNELITRILIKKDKLNYSLYKNSLRKDLDISAVTFGASFVKEGGRIKHFALSYGGVAATVIRMKSVEAFLVGKEWKEETFNEASELIYQEVKPLSDVRGSAEFRRILCRNMLKKFYMENA